MGLSVFFVSRSLRCAGHARYVFCYFLCRACHPRPQPSLCRRLSCALALVPSRQVFLFTPASAAATKLEEKKSTLTADVSKATAALAEVEGEVARLKAKLYSKFGGVRFGRPSPPPRPLVVFFPTSHRASGRVCWRALGRCGVHVGTLWDAACGVGLLADCRAWHGH